jgi:hypothetical protein
MKFFMSFFGLSVFCQIKARQGHATWCTLPQFFQYFMVHLHDIFKHGFFTTNLVPLADTLNWF